MPALELELELEPVQVQVQVQVQLLVPGQWTMHWLSAAEQLAFAPLRELGAAKTLQAWEAVQWVRQQPEVPAQKKSHSSRHFGRRRKMRRGPLADGRTALAQIPLRFSLAPEPAALVRPLFPAPMVQMWSGLGPGPGPEGEVLLVVEEPS